MNKIQKIKIIPNDNSIRSLGKLNIRWEDSAFECFNNAIQAAEDRNLDLDITVNFYFDDQEKLNSITIRDKSGGIKRADIQSALTPGHRNSDIVTLSEHGLGLNVAMEYLTKDLGSCKLISHIGDDSFYIDEKISYSGHVTLNDFESTEPMGLELSFCDVYEAVQMTFPIKWTSKGYNIWQHACKKYRYKHEHFVSMGKKFNITFNYHCGERTFQRIFSPVHPVLNNPITGKNDWVTEFSLEHEGLEAIFKLGLADDKKDKYRYEMEGGYHLSYQIHPYRVSHATIGFEAFYKDILIEEASVETLRFTTTSYGHEYNEISLMRGEMHIVKGGKSVFTKNKLDNDIKLSILKQKAIDIFKGRQPHPNSGKSINYMKDYIHRANYAKDGIPHERIIKYRHREIFESLGLEVRQEETNQFGIVDMIVNDVIMEHKRKQSNQDDVLQLFKYIVAYIEDDRYNTFELWAPSHSDASKAIAKTINSNILKGVGKSIQLKVLPNIILKSELSAIEKEMMKK